MDPANPYAPPQASVHDVVDPNAPMELAGRGSRFAAAIVDGLVGLLVGMPAIIVFGVVGATGGDLDDGTLGVAGLIGILLTCLLGLAWLVVTIMLVLENGQTIGKKALDIKVVRTDGSRASFSRILWLRNVVNVLLGFIPAYSIIDHLFIFGEAHQCLHDKIADTIVVRA